jgi:hypothetical protein
LAAAAGSALRKRCTPSPARAQPRSPFARSSPRVTGQWGSLVARDVANPQSGLLHGLDGARAVNVDNCVELFVEARVKVVRLPLAVRAIDHADGAHEARLGEHGKRGGGARLLGGRTRRVAGARRNRQLAQVQEEARHRPQSLRRRRDAVH